MYHLHITIRGGLLNCCSALAVAGGILSLITGNEHPFGLDNEAISYPYKDNTVSFLVLVIITIVAPGVIIFVLALALTDSDLSLTKPASRSPAWRRRLWSLHIGWLGLALSLAGSFFITTGLKDLVGKPRPNLIARCDPDLSNIQAHVVGGLGFLFEEAPVLVTKSICRQKDSGIVKDGFASFPSGHSSFSFAGLGYLALWLCAKLAISIPYLSLNTRSARTAAAAPPLYLLTLVLAPVAIAIFVCASRWSDNQHAGFDIISGALIGIVFSWGSFRYYHLPVREGKGWAWGPRSREKAFWMRGDDENKFLTGGVGNRPREVEHDVELGMIDGESREGPVRQPS